MNKYLIIIIIIAAFLAGGVFYETIFVPHTTRAPARAEELNVLKPNNVKQIGVAGNPF